MGIVQQAELAALVPLVRSLVPALALTPNISHRHGHSPSPSPDPNPHQVRSLAKAMRPREREEEVDPSGGGGPSKQRSLRRLAGPWETHGRQRWLTTIEPEEGLGCGGLEGQASDSAAAAAEAEVEVEVTRAEAEAEKGRAAARHRLVSSLGLGQSFLRMLASQVLPRA